MNEYTEYHSNLTDRELVNIAYFDLRKFKREARLSAKATIKRRGLSKDRIESLKNEIRARKRQERNQKLRDKDVNYGIFDFILEIVFGFWGL